MKRLRIWCRPTHYFYKACQDMEFTHALKILQRHGSRIRTNKLVANNLETLPLLAFIIKNYNFQLDTDHLIALLLSKHQDINQVIDDEYASTLLHYAATCKEPTILQLILTFFDQTIDINKPDAEGNTPLITAVKAKFYRNVGILLNEKNINLHYINNDDHEAFYLLCQPQVTEIGNYNFSKARHFITQPPCLLRLTQIKNFLEHPSFNLSFCLHKYGLLHMPLDIDIIKLFLDRNEIELNYCNFEENTPLHTLIKPQEVIIEGLNDEKQLARIIELYSLHQAQININAQNAAGDTPLHLACRRGSYLLVKALLKFHDIQVNIENKRHETALHNLANPEKDKKIIELLLTKGARLYYDFEQDENEFDPYYSHKKVIESITKSDKISDISNLSTQENNFSY